MGGGQSHADWLLPSGTSSLAKTMYTMIEWWGWLIVWFLYTLGLCHIMLSLTIPVQMLMWSKCCHTLIKYTATQGWAIWQFKLVINLEGIHFSGESQRLWYLMSSYFCFLNWHNLIGWWILALNTGQIPSCGFPFSKVNNTMWVYRAFQNWEKHMKFTL